MDLGRGKEAAYEVIAGDTGDKQALKAAMQGMDAVVTCLPFHLNQGIAHFNSPFIHYVIIVFMFLAGMNFTVHYYT